MEVGHSSPVFVNANSLFDDMMTQCDVMCQKVKDHPVFGKSQINVFGISQGGLMARCVATMCDLPYNVHNLLTLGSPNMGVGGVPFCYSTSFCRLINWWVEQGIY